jgi:hypothetical protein
MSSDLESTSHSPHNIEAHVICRYPRSSGFSSGSLVTQRTHKEQEQLSVSCLRADSSPVLSLFMNTVREWIWPRRFVHSADFQAFVLRCLALHTTRSDTQFYALPTQFIAVIRMDLRTKSNYFGTQLIDSHIFLWSRNGTSPEYFPILPKKLSEIRYRRWQHDFKA